MSEMKGVRVLCQDTYRAERRKRTQLPFSVTYGETDDFANLVLSSIRARSMNEVIARVAPRGWGANPMAFHQLMDLAIKAEDMLNTGGVPAFSRGGAEMVHTLAGPPRRGAPFPVLTTEMTLRRSPNGDWYLAKVAQVEVYPGTDAASRLIVNERVVCDDAPSELVLADRRDMEARRGRDSGRG